jgi:hypothetical protein
MTVAQLVAQEARFLLATSYSLIDDLAFGHSGDSMRRELNCVFLVFVAVSILTSVSQAADSSPNGAIALYQQLRNPAAGTEAFSVHDLVLRRDAAVFTLHSGTVCLLSPVDGVVTGAVFTGAGDISLETDSEMERAQIKLLTKEPALHEEFDKLVLRFSDVTADEIRKSPAVTPAAPAGCKTNLLDDVSKKLRFPIRYNLAARLLQDVLAGDTNGVFYAFIYGEKYSNRMLFVVDPHGVPNLLVPSNRSAVPDIDIAPEEVALFTYDERHFGVWYAHHLKPEYAAGLATGTQQNAFIHATNHTLDVSIEKNGALSGTAATTIQSNVSRLQVVPFDLYDELRVENVTDASGQPLSFIQEDKHDDPQYSVILAKPLQRGEPFTVITKYSGKNVVVNEDFGNYYPIARTDWYPNTRMGDYANYDLTLRVPKGLVTIATGKFLSETVQGDKSVTKWKSEVPLAVAGFNLGGFREESQKLEGMDLTIAAYANEEPNWLLHVHKVWGGENTKAGLSQVLKEGMAAAMIYSSIFGPASYSRFALTQQIAPNYGQAWPGLVFVPMTAFLARPLNGPAARFLQTVVAHEVGHQWWGHTVGWNSYRDQWMSEGFAEFSASLYVQRMLGEDEYLQFWKEQRRLLTERDAEGFRSIDVGPLVMGTRLSSVKAGLETYRDLIYPKGAYVLHMLRMMMWTPQEKDARFSATMQDFLETFRNRPASTEDFQHIVEKHMSPAMNLTHNGKMDWFFDEWVRGTALPQYDFRYTLDKDKDGAVLLWLRIQQSNVSDDFQMPVPVYIETANGQFARLGGVAVKGNNSREGKLRLGKLDAMPKRALINYQYDVLCAQ